MSRESKRNYVSQHRKKYCHVIVYYVGSTFADRASISESIRPPIRLSVPYPTFLLKTSKENHITFLRILSMVFLPAITRS